MDEQVRIATLVVQSSAAADRVVDRAHHQIALLREYRTRLIADVVTGKLDVRAAAAALPEESDEPEALEEEAFVQGEEVEESDLDATSEEADI